MLSVSKLADPDVHIIRRWLIVNLVALFMAVVAVGTVILKMSDWVATVNASIRVQTKVVSELAAQDQRWDDIRATQAAQGQKLDDISAALGGPTGVPHHRVR